ncbi:MAG: glycosyltransferase family 2 protein [Planctomycetota bacterium]|jgi:glycosyltransferase involved in cell wall biosynthesis
MKQKPVKLSVVTVTYQRAGVLGDALDSVLSQLDQVHQHVVIDGGSADGTPEILKAYERRYAGKLNWMSEPDEGIYSAMNKGIELATGDYVSILNSDDWYLPGALARVTEVLCATGSPEVLHGAVRFCTPEGDRLRTNMPAADAQRELRRGMLVRHPAAFIRRDVHERHGLYDTSFRITADYELMLRFARAGVSFVPLREELTCMRDGGVSNQAGNRLAISREHLRIWQRHLPGTARLRFWYDVIRHGWSVRARPWARRPVRDERGGV